MSSISGEVIKVGGWPFPGDIMVSLNREKEFCIQTHVEKDTRREEGHMATKPRGKKYHVTPEAEAVETRYRPRIPRVTVHSWRGEEAKRQGRKSQRGYGPGLRYLASGTTKPWCFH